MSHYAISLLNAAAAGMLIYLVCTTASPWVGMVMAALAGLNVITAFGAMYRAHAD